ncbi:MAG: LutB/LldF family L-lactate oxidation iron-sulfur protein [Planctomycetota bacterium]|nr:LutB/LldF family L-lactate oxidation iron-sulfur protein [Planctomycetota bacterium]
MNQPEIPTSVDGKPILFPGGRYDIRTRAEVFLQDEVLQGAVREATTLKDQARRDALEQAFGDDVAEIRKLAGAIKQHTIDHLDHYLEQWIDRAEAAGTRVHLATTAQEANRIVVEIAREERVRLCVKSKSMVTEETQLVPQLEAAGIETVETDLGEFILQIDHDAPSHIVMPMIHKDRSSVARAFEKVLGARYTEEPEELTAIARDHLRGKYKEADLGISGGNFLVAESGSVVICTNEGNGRFCTSVPKTHIAVVGIEKLIPGFDDLSVLLHLLARSATGQPLTCYTQILTGPKQPQELDGPEQMHVVLVDAGRTKILADPEFRSALHCIRCGACLNACPVYRKVTGHAYGSVYSGPIGAVITPLLSGIDKNQTLPEASSLCGACNEACPVDIDLAGLLVGLRRKIRKKRGSWLERVALSLLGFAFSRTTSYRIASKLQRFFLLCISAGSGTVHSAPGPFSGWTKDRDLNLPPRRSFRDRWARKGGRVR